MMSEMWSKIYVFLCCRIIQFNQNDKNKNYNISCSSGCSEDVARVCVVLLVIHLNGHSPVGQSDNFWLIWIGCYWLKGLLTIKWEMLSTAWILSLEICYLLKQRNENTIVNNGMCFQPWQMLVLLCLYHSWKKNTPKSVVVHLGSVV